MEKLDCGVGGVQNRGVVVVATDRGHGRSLSVACCVSLKGFEAAPRRGGWRERFERVNLTQADSIQRFLVLESRIGYQKLHFSRFSSLATSIAVMTLAKQSERGKSHSES